MGEGYDTYDWPEGFYPGGTVGACASIPPDGRGAPEQVLMNCQITTPLRCVKCVPKLPDLVNSP